MTQLNLIVNSLPRELLEFTFFLAVGFTAGSVGLIYLKIFFYNPLNLLREKLYMNIALKKLLNLDLG